MGEASLKSTLPLPLESNITEQTKESRQGKCPGVNDSLSKEMSPTPQNSDVARWVEEDRQGHAFVSVIEGDALKDKRKARKKAILSRLPAIQCTSECSTSAGERSAKEDEPLVVSTLPACSDIQSSANLPASHLRVRTEPELPLINALNVPAGNLRVRTYPELPMPSINPLLEVPEHIDEAMEELRLVVERLTGLERIALLPGAVAKRVHSDRTHLRVAPRRITV
jgi:hypothetical protein